MRKIIASVFLSLMLLGSVAVSSADARPWFRGYRYGYPAYSYPYYSGYYGPGYGGYYNPGYSYYGPTYYYPRWGWRRWW